MVPLDQKDIISSLKLDYHKQNLWYHPWTFMDIMVPLHDILDVIGDFMHKDITELVSKLDNLSRRLKHLNKDEIINTLHLMELFCELSDIVLEFDIESYSDEDSSTEENKKPT